MDVTSSMQRLEEDGISVALTHEKLAAEAAMNAVRSSKAGAIVLFAGEHGVQPIMPARLRRLQELRVITSTVGLLSS